MDAVRRRELRTRADENVRRGFGFTDFLSAGETEPLPSDFELQYCDPTAAARSAGRESEHD